MPNEPPARHHPGDACGIGPEIVARLFRGEEAEGGFVVATWP
jgi:hypothetical protein